MKDVLKFRGDAVIELRKKDGTVIEREEVENLIVNTGKERVAKLINGVDTTIFTAIAIGTGNTSPSASDTALQTEVTRATATKTYVADYKARFTYTFTFGSGESYSITEAGVFDNAIASGSVMLDRFTFAPKSVDADTDLNITVTLTVS